jgi:hypothetical protein
MDATQLAGFGDKVRLLNEHTALAFKYALSRKPADVLAAKKGQLKGAKGGKMEDSHNVLLYDVGSTTATASLATITMSPKTEGRKIHVAERLTIRSVAFESGVGGLSIDGKIAALLADRHNTAMRELAAEQTVGGGWFGTDGKAQNASSWDIRTVHGGRAMFRLLAEAQKLKEILSANMNIPVNIPSLPAPAAPGGGVAEADLKTEITREGLEDIISGLVDVMLDPVRRVLDDTGVPRSDIDAAVIVGGGVRVPLLQERLKKLLKRENLDTRLNGDDAVAHGLAAFGAAQQSNGNTMKALRRDVKIVGDRYPHGLTPNKFSLVKPLGQKGPAWDHASAGVGRLTAKAAALAAWQQAVSDFEAMIFDWDDRLDPKRLEAEEAQRLLEEESAAEAAAEETEEDAGEGGDAPELVQEEPLFTKEERASNQTAQRQVLVDVKAWLETVAETGGAADVVVFGDGVVPATTEGVADKLAETEAKLNELEPPQPPELQEEEEESFDFDKLLEEGDAPGGRESAEGDDGFGFDYAPSLSEVERQQGVLYTFYQLHAPKTREEVTTIIRRRVDAEGEGEPGAMKADAFDVLCGKLEGKYGESPISVWEAAQAAASDPGHADEPEPEEDDDDL